MKIDSVIITEITRMTKYEVSFNADKCSSFPSANLDFNQMNSLVRSFRESGFDFRTIVLKDDFFKRISITFGLPKFEIDSYDLNWLKTYLNKPVDRFPNSIRDFVQNHEVLDIMFPESSVEFWKVRTAEYEALYKKERREKEMILQKFGSFENAVKAIHDLFEKGGAK